MRFASRNNVERVLRRRKGKRGMFSSFFSFTSTNRRRLSARYHCEHAIQQVFLPFNVSLFLSYYFFSFSLYSFSFNDFLSFVHTLQFLAYSILIFILSKFSVLIFRWKVFEICVCNIIFLLDGTTFYALIHKCR